MVRIIAVYALAAFATFVVLFFGRVEAFRSPARWSTHGGLTDPHVFPEWATPAPSQAATYEASGIVAAVDPALHRLTIDHGAVQSMGWPVWITVRYATSNAKALSGIHVGERVLVVFRKYETDLEAIDVTPD